MKHIIFSSLALFASSVYSENGQNGWDIECKVSSGEDNPGPAYLSSKRDGGNLNMYWSSFGRGYAAIEGNGPFGVKGDGNACMSVSNDTTLLVSDPEHITMPNEVDQVPIDIFGDNYLAIPSGAATIADRDGCVAVANLNGALPVGPENIQILTDGCGYGRIGKTKYFYRVAKWFDMDGDGLTDLLTARASGATDEKNVTESDLVWFKNPGEVFSPGDNTWKSYVIPAAANIADKHLDVFQSGDNIYVIAGGFAAEKLILLSGSNWKKTSSVTATLIDHDGRYNYQQFVDLDKDGTLDLIVTVGSYGEKEGQLIVYPGVSSSSGYSLGARIVVKDDFPVFSNDGVNSPGRGQPFWYGVTDDSDGLLPQILIDGDDDGYMYLASPTTTTGTFNFEYTVMTIFESKVFNPFVTVLTAPTLGKPTFADMNEDGCFEVIIANYADSELVVLEQRTYTACQRWTPPTFNPPTFVPPTKPPKPTPTWRPNVKINRN